MQGNGPEDADEGEQGDVHAEVMGTQGGFLKARLRPVRPVGDGGGGSSGSSSSGNRGADGGLGQEPAISEEERTTHEDEGNRVDEEDDEVQCQVCDEGEEGRPPIRMPAPCRPSQKEIDEHNLTHTPFRSWCRYCVRGRGTNNPHMKKHTNKEEDKPGVARMSMDYGFLSKEEELAQDNPMLVMVDEQTGDRYARMTGAKGIGENQERDWLIKDMSEELKDWGHTGGEGGHNIKV